MTPTAIRDMYQSRIAQLEVALAAARDLLDHAVRTHTPFHNPPCPLLAWHNQPSGGRESGGTTDRSTSRGRSAAERSAPTAANPPGLCQCPDCGHPANHPKYTDTDGAK